MSKKVIQQKIEKEKALEIAKEYFRIRLYLMAHPKIKEIPLSLINQGNGKALLEIKDNKFIVTKLNSLKKIVWMLSYQKETHPQIENKKISYKSIITKKILNKQGEGKIVNIFTNFNLHKAEIIEVISLKNEKPLNEAA